MIKAIIFDCFGVLAEDGWLPFKRKYLGDDEGLIEQVADLGKQNEYGYISNDEHQEKISQLLGVDRGTIQKALRHKVPNTELFNYIRDELKSKFKIGLLSNANFDVGRELFEPWQTGLFDGIVLSYEVKLIKPDPRMFRLMADRLGVEVDDCMLVDDVERYYAAAKGIGMEAILYKDVSQLKSELSRFL